MNKTTVYTSAIALMLTLLPWLQPPAGAALTDISDTPLSSPNNSVVKPNMMFILDDSGSMNEQRTPDHAGIQMCYDSWDDGPSNILEESSASANRNDNCRLNDPPLSSPDINFQYYNPEFTYSRAVCFNGECATYPNMNPTATKTDAFGLDNVTQIGTTVSTVNLTTQYPDIQWCDDRNANPTTNPERCRTNTAPSGSNAYLYPDHQFGTSRNSSGGVRYKFGGPYYFRPTVSEHCTTEDLIECIASTSPTGSYVYPARVRWCENAGQTDLAVPSTGCQLRSDSRHRVPRYLGRVTGGTGGTATRSTATFTVTNAGVERAINAVWVNGVNIINVVINGTGNTSTTAQAICRAINTFVSSPDYTAGTGGSTNNCNALSPVVTVAAAVTGTEANGRILSITSGVTRGPTRSSATITVLPTSGNSRLTNITVGSVSIITGPLDFENGANTSAVASAIAAAINSRVSAPDYTATVAGNVITVTAVDTGAASNGPLTVTAIGVAPTATLTYVTVPPGSNTSRVEVDTICRVTTPAEGKVYLMDGLVSATGADNTARVNNMASGVRSMINGSTPSTGISATVSGAVITATAPVGNRFNGSSLCPTVSVGIVWSGTVFVGGRNGQPTSVTDMNGGGSGNDNSNPIVINPNPATFGGGTIISAVGGVRSGTGSWERVDIIPSVTTYPKAPSRTDCAAAEFCTYAEELQNFANWYGYYRTRMNMMKTAAGRAFLDIDDNFRVGFITINVGTEASRYLKIDRFNSTQKQAWYDKFYAQRPTGDTRLPIALTIVGRYYGGKSDDLNAITTDDPVEYECQQNFALLTTDGMWNGATGRKLDNTAMGNEDGAAARPYFDGSGSETVTTSTFKTESYGTTGCSGTQKRVMQTTTTTVRTVRTNDAGNTLLDTTTPPSTTTPVAITGCSASPRALQSPNPSNPTSTSTSTTTSAPGTLSDVAYYYYHTDLRPEKANKVPDIDDKTRRDRPQHMVTYTLGLGVNGNMIYKPDYEEPTTTSDYRLVSKPTIRTATNCTWQTTGANCEWPAPASSNEAKVDDLWHAAVNGHGKYYSARDPETLSSGLRATMDEIRGQVGAASAAATSNANIKSGDNLVYSATFTTVEWTGEVVAQEINITTGEVAPAKLWSAKDKLETQIGTNTDTRTIYMFDPATSSKLAPFTWSNLMSAGLNSYFRNACVSSGDHPALTQCATLSIPEKVILNNGQYMVNFLRGQREYEDGSVFRDRVKALGDIAHATPAFVSSPIFDFADAVTPSYTNFKTTNAERQQMIYVAANDGFLHAIKAGNDADGGKESWAYAPRMIFPTMYHLADTQYGDNHRNFVDATPVVMDIYDGTGWRTILVGGLGAGGRGYYALDVTDPASPKALWERCSDATLCPNVNTLDMSDEDMGLSFGNPIITKLPLTSAYPGEWVVLLTSGYNNVSPGDGKGYLYVVRALTGELLFKVSTNVGNSATPSGLAKITAWAENANTDNTSKWIYGGDLLGNLWKFDLTSATPTAVKLGEALDASGATQAITTRPELGKLPSFADPVIFFGTGRYLGSCDVSFESGCSAPDVTTQTQTIYAIKDRIFSSNGTTSGVYFAGGFRDSAAGLVEQRLSEVEDEGDTIRVVAEPEEVDWTDPGVGGWFVDLSLSAGERVDLDPQLVLGTLVVVGNVPQAGTSNACAVGGTSWLYQFNFQSGAYLDSLSSTRQVGGRISDNGLSVGVVIFRLPGGTLKALATDATGSMIPMTVTTQNPGGAAHRSSWREIIR